jgi:hypothetical protein
MEWVLVFKKDYGLVLIKCSFVMPILILVWGVLFRDLSGFWASSMVRACGVRRLDLGSGLFYFASSLGENNNAYLQCYLRFPKQFMVC